MGKTGCERAQADGDPWPQLACLAQEVPRSRCAPEDMACMCGDAELQKSVEACVLAGCHVREALSKRPAVPAGRHLSN